MPKHGDIPFVPVASKTSIEVRVAMLDSERDTDNWRDTTWCELAKTLARLSSGISRHKHAVRAIDASFIIRLLIKILERVGGEVES